METCYSVQLILDSSRQTVRVEISALFDFLHCNILGQGKSNKTPEPNFNHRLIEVCK